MVFPDWDRICFIMSENLCKTRPIQLNDIVNDFLGNYFTIFIARSRRILIIYFESKIFIKLSVVLKVVLKLINLEFFQKTTIFTVSGFFFM